MFRLLAFVVMLCAAATSVSAETRRMCFESGTAVVSPEGYAAVRETLAELSGRPPFRAHIVVLVPGGPDATGLDGQRLQEAQLELGRLGVTFGAIRLAEGAVSADCVGLEVDPKSYLALWHYYGPYFEADSSIISEAARRSLRFAVARHEPGASKFCVEGHADITEASPDKLSRERAENLARELIRHGVPDADIETRAYGVSRLARTPTGGAEPLNRRVFVDQRTICRFDR